MIWSKLRVKVRANLCKELRDRLDFHVTAYRKSHDSDYGRAWISVDGHQIASWSCFEQLLHPLPLEKLRARFPGGWRVFEYDRFASERGIYSEREFKLLLGEYLNLDPHAALSSAVPLIRMLAVIDKRIGARTLSRFAIHEEPDMIVQLLYRLRTQESQQALHRMPAPPRCLAIREPVRGRHRGANR